MTAGIFVGQIGVTIELETLDDAAILADATKKEIWYSVRSGSVTGKWSAELSETKLVYTTTKITDLLIHGNWTLQAYVEGVGYKILGEKVIMPVGRPVLPII